MTELAVGTVDGATAPAALLAAKFNRHTFWCGQSGSGKTYALGVVLEELLLRTELPLVIVDPNADFVRLGEVREGVDAEIAAALSARDIRVLRPASLPGDDLRARFSSMLPQSKAAVLRLDPIVDRAEYNAFLHLSAVGAAAEATALMQQLLDSSDPGQRAIAQRIENLGVLDWQMWAGKHAAASELIDERPDATVLDVGGFAHPDEALTVVLSVLDDLWQKREQRRPVLIVIDEAHNVCSPELSGPLAVAVRERIIQIAAEGRKYGLWMLLSTQRPSKVHPGVISQCDNLGLMKMSSPADLAELGSVFGFVPSELMARAAVFEQGQALLAGGFAPADGVVRMRARYTHEGGADVRVPVRG
ncbi:ATP-binding protein [Microcella humidisoli]|uniref:ATP-binding protein n=1 Tax=Microcella humidisoli TaxID=2963406 RepID=A0ABY5FUG1_9MICO|nr:ATP-binding protein [Microcella humidisoli]UTT61945.1 ATP-binding protein [Microcella humidisoli]